MMTKQSLYSRRAARVQLPAEGWRGSLLAAAVLLAAGFVALRGARADVEGLAVHGFVDAGYTYTDQPDPPSKTGFRLGTLDLYLSPQLGDRVKALMEVVWEFDSWYNNGQADTDVERLQIGYTVSDDLTVWLGRFHTPYGYYNTAYHHGGELQPTVLRPQFLAFEDHGGILPAHTVGLWFTGHKAEGGLGRITYDLYFGNGSRILPDSSGKGQIDMNSVGDDNGNHAYGGRFGYQFSDGPLDGLWIGVHGLKEEIDAYLDSSNSNSPTSKTQLAVLGAFEEWDVGNWEWLTEYYHFNNTTLLNTTGPSFTPVASSADGKHTSSAAYTQVSYLFQGRISPYLRYEVTNFDQADPYFTSLDGGLSFRRGLIGVRYDVSPAACVKLEMDRTDAKRDGGNWYTDARLQLAVRF